MRRTTTEDMGIIATILTMMNKWKTMNKIISHAEFTMKEWIIAVDSLEKGNIGSKGIKADGSKGADEETMTFVHEIFNLIIEQGSMTPSSWKRPMITVIYTREDPTTPENHRPICSFPVLYNTRMDLGKSRRRIIF